MVKIRLRRMGAKKQPTYRFVVCDSKSPRDGAFIEILGHYNPRTEPKTVVINEEKAKAWLANGGFEVALGADGKFEKKSPAAAK